MRFQIQSVITPPQTVRCELLVFLDSNGDVIQYGWSVMDHITEEVLGMGSIPISDARGHLSPAYAIERLVLAARSACCDPFPT